MDKLIIIKINNANNSNNYSVLVILKNFSKIILIFLLIVLDDAKGPKIKVFYQTEPVDDVLLSDISGEFFFK